MVDAIATVDESGKKWAVAIINRSPSKELACTLQMAELSIDGTYKATVLTGDSPDSYNDNRTSSPRGAKEDGINLQERRSEPTSSFIGYC